MQHHVFKVIVRTEPLLEFAAISRPNLGDTGVVPGFLGELMSMLVVRMSLGGIGDEEDCRSIFADCCDKLQRVSSIQPDVAIFEAEILTYFHPKDPCRLCSFSCSKRCIPPGAKFSTSEVEDSNGSTLLDELRYRSTAGQLDVIRMCADC